MYESFISSTSRTLTALQRACAALWLPFTEPIRSGRLSARDHAALVNAARSILRNSEQLLNPGILAPDSQLQGTAATTTASAAVASAARKRPDHNQQQPGLAALLPTTARLLLVAASLASHLHTKHDQTLFSTFSTHRRKRGGGASAAGRKGGGRRPKHRKIDSRLLGAHTFPLERLTAIYAAVRGEWAAGADASLADDAGSARVDTDVAMALATLASLRLLVKAGAAGADPMDRSGRWKVNISWDAVVPIGRSVGIEVDEWMIE